ncbi:hypothetical protein MKSMC1_11170 [Mycobacterium kansasii]|nr:hypothetical protein MKSMC1_11170 [Mycobacterium kansasii]
MQARDAGGGGDRHCDRRCQTGVRSAPPAPDQRLDEDGGSQAAGNSDAS